MKRDSFQPPCGPVYSCEDVGIPSCRCRQGAHQVHVYMAESAGGNRNLFDRRRRLRSHPSSLAVLSILCLLRPSSHIHRHAFPGEQAGYQAASRPHSWVCHLVYGGENLPPLAFGHHWPGLPLQDVAGEEHTCNTLRYNVEGGCALQQHRFPAPWLRSHHDPGCAAAMTTRSNLANLAGGIAGLGLMLDRLFNPAICSSYQPSVPAVWEQLSSLAVWEQLSGLAVWEQLSGPAVGGAAIQSGGVGAAIRSGSVGGPQRPG